MNTNNEFKKELNKGFTLIELLVSTAILVILAGGFLGIQYIFSQNQVSAWKSYNNIEEVNRILQSLVKEIRDARQSEDGAYLLDTANDQEIIFYSDYDYDGVVEKIRYSLSGTNLIKGVTRPSGDPLEYLSSNEIVDIISPNIRNGSSPVFYYFDENYPEDTINNPLVQGGRIANTRVVKILLVINQEPDEPESDFQLESISTIRMLNII